MKISIFILACCLSVFATDHYVCAGATGTNTGLGSWTNACPDFAGSCSPTSLTRGDTYWVANGSYCGSGCSFNVADSSTTVITIQKATDAAHGASSVGWSNGGSGTCNSSQATFTARIEFLTDYWTWTGVYRSTATGLPWTDWATGYGFKVNQNCAGVACNSVYAVGLGGGNGGGTCTGQTFEYTEIAGAKDFGTGTDDALELFATGVQCSTTHIDHNYIHDIDGGFAVTISSNILIEEYNYFQNGGAYSPGNHGEGVVSKNNTGQTNTNHVIRYNLIENYMGTAYMANPCGCSDIGAGNWFIYGNIFWGNQGDFTGAQNLDGVGNGWYAPLNITSFSGDLYVVNNTFARISEQGGSSGVAFSGGFANNGSTVNNFVYENNLYYQVSQSVNLPTCGVGGSTFTCTTSTIDYNWYKVSSTNDTTTHVQTGSGNPFSNAGGNTAATNDFRLASNTNSGATISNSPPSGLTQTFSTDMLGNTRTTWTRGALEFSSATVNTSPSVLLRSF